MLKDNPPDVYDTVLSLSLIYAFDDAQLSQFFRFVGRALKPDGRLLLDLAGSPDTFLTWLLHDVYLPTEAAMLAGYLSVRLRAPHRVRAVLHGYRRSDDDVLRVARQAGLTLVDVRHDCFNIELGRSVVLKRSRGATALGAKILSRLGRRMPYVRWRNLFAAGKRNQNQEKKTRGRPNLALLSKIAIVTALRAF